MEGPLPAHVAEVAIAALGESSSRTSSSSRRDVMVETLRSAILSGELEEGEIYPAPAIAAQLGVSTTPVREAMIKLSEDRLISVLPNRGFLVTSPTPREIDDILDARVLLEVPAIRRLAGQGLDDAHYRRLHAVASESVASAETLDLSANVRADLEFHVGLVALAGNDEVTRMVRSLRSRWRLRGLGSPEKRAALLRSAHEHLEILRLVREQREEEAAALLERHLVDAGEVWKADAGEARRLDAAG